jgi:hypothetical protein
MERELSATASHPSAKEDTRTNRDTVPVAFGQDPTSAGIDCSSYNKLASDRRRFRVEGVEISWQDELVQTPIPGHFRDVAIAETEPMKPIYDYLDYREYLKDFYEEKKLSSAPYSYRSLAVEFGLDTGNTYRILQGNAHLPARCISRAMEILDLSGDLAEYFLVLITCSRERNEKARKEMLEKAKALRGDAQKNALGQNANPGRGAFKSVSVMMDGRREPDGIEDGIARAFEFLLEQGLVKKAKSGKLVLSQPRLSALSNRIPAIAGTSSAMP